MQIEFAHESHLAFGERPRKTYEERIVDFLRRGLSREDFWPTVDGCPQWPWEEVMGLFLLVLCLKVIQSGIAAWDTHRGRDGTQVHRGNELGVLSINARVEHNTVWVGTHQP